MNNPIGQLHPNGQFELFGDELPMHLEFPVKLYARTFDTESKPLSTQETLEEAVKRNCGKTDQLNAFFKGVQFAERHHGISQNTPSLNDTISASSRDSGHG